MSHADTALVEGVRRALADAADPRRAPAMQAYMKSTMPYRGVPMPRLRQAVRPALAAHPVRDREVWVATVLELYDRASYREERYAALTLLAARAARPWHDPELVPLLEHLVVTGAWWDLVDEVAGRHVAPLHRAFPVELATVVRRWAAAEDLWLRRTAILSQLGSRAGTDRALLADVILANAASREFFHRKAIGWALRDLSRSDPAWVSAFVDEHRDALSGLTVREATRHLPVATHADGASGPSALPPPVPRVVTGG